jgi:hypothetical protein
LAARFDQYVNLRLARLLPGLVSPLRECQRFDVAIVRENTEGEYSDVGGRYATPAGDVPAPVRLRMLEHPREIVTDEILQLNAGMWWRSRVRSGSEVHRFKHPFGEMHGLGAV